MAAEKRNAQKQPPRLYRYYVDTARKELQGELNVLNIMQVPRLEKIVLNIGVKSSVSDSKVLSLIMEVLDGIAGQKSVKTLARKSIAGFKIREGFPIGVKVTLRRNRMYAFLDKLISVSLPRVRDFQGITPHLDGKGNYNLGIKEWMIFPEVDVRLEKVFGLNITMVTTAKADEEGRALLRKLGLPFKQEGKA